MANKTQIAQHRKEWLRLLKKADTIDDPTARAVADFLRQSRTRIADMLVSAEGFDKFRLQNLLRAVDETFGQFNVQATQKLTADLVTSFDFGIGLFDEPFRAAGASQQLSALPMISREALEAHLERGSQFITNLSSDAATKIRAEITLGLTGEKTAADVMKEIGRTIDKGRFASISARAEAIVRTEINSALNTATLRRANQATNEFTSMRKFWLTAMDSRVRETHRAAERRTNPSKGGTPIQMRQNFHLSGRSAKGPHDPNLKPKDLVNCRCRLGFDISRVDIAPGLMF